MARSAEIESSDSYRTAAIGYDINRSTQHIEQSVLTVFDILKSF